MKIGIAGTGRMGEAIGYRLMDLGHELTVWNRTAGKTKALAGEGARVAASPTVLAGAAEVIITILTDDKAIEALYHGPQGLLSGNVAGKLLIEMSTVRPEVEIALGAKVKQKGAAFVECPVSGTTGPATGRAAGLPSGATGASGPVGNATGVTRLFMWRRISRST